MRYIKLFGILTLVSASASFVLFLFSYNLSALTAENSKKQTKSSLEENFTSIVKQTGLNNKIGSTKVAPTENYKKEENLTQSFIEELTNEIVTKNPAGVATIDGELSLVAPNEISISDFAAKNSKLIDWRNFIPKISDKDIKITSINSSKEYKKYLTSLYGIIKETLSDTSSATETQPKQKDYYQTANAVVNKYENTIQAVYALPTPEGLKEFHKKELALLIAQKNVYQKVSGAKKDPLSALIAMQANKKIDAAFSDLKKELKTTIENTL
ncbi:MAG: hypothetical protein HYT12_01570 [Candidatus Liptonbacteria bacterium]|nr:hypothetical protein [Candidatus Liptonbacteria bacterium]